MPMLRAILATLGASAVLALSACGHNGSRSYMVLAGPNGEQRVVEVTPTAEFISARKGPNRYNEAGETPLAVAARYGMIEGIQELLERGADPNHPSLDGTLPIDEANNPMAAELLLRAGAKETLASRLRVADRKARLAMLADDSLAWSDPGAQRALGNLALWQEAADAATLDATLARLKSSEAHSRVLNLALAEAISRRDAARAAQLLAQGASRDSRSREGYPVIAEAFEAGDWDSLRLLLDAGVSPESRTKAGYPLLAEAFDDGNAELVEDLMARGASANGRTKSGYPFLAEAVEKGDREMVARLLRHGADARVRGIDGYSLLERAIARKDNALLKDLLAAGADPRARSSYGTSLVESAVQAGNTEAARILLDAMEKAKAAR